MKFFHISDLHVGKRVNGFSMMEDQRWIFRQILELAKKEQPDGILIAGDLYDKQLPSAEAVELVDEFLYGFVKLKIPVWAVSGNHDSAERVAYGARMMERSGLYLSRMFDGSMQKISFETKDKERADIYLLPFLKPASVRRFFPEREIATTQQAVEAVLDGITLAQDRVNILVMHQFMAGAVSCESEELSVGGSDQVDAALVESFDYVALGHLHGAQRVGRENTRYCGSPLKYSFSEASQKKSVTVVEFCRNEEGRAAMEEMVDGMTGQVFLEIMADGMSRQGEQTGNGYQTTIRRLLLYPLHDLREIGGPIAELLSPEVVSAADSEDYLHVTLTDEGEVLDAIGRLRAVYPNLMRLDFARGEQQPFEEEEIRPEEKSPQELFADFFAKQYGTELSEEQQKLVDAVWRRVNGAEPQSGETSEETLEERLEERSEETSEELSSEKLDAGDLTEEIHRSNRGLDAAGEAGETR